MSISNTLITSTGELWEGSGVLLGLVVFSEAGHTGRKERCNGKNEHDNKAHLIRCGDQSVSGKPE